MDGHTQLHAVLTHHGGQAQGNALDAVIPVNHGGDGQDGMFIADNALADALDRHGHAVVGGALLLDDGVSAVLHFLIDLVSGGNVVVVVAPQLAELRQRQSAHIHAAPGRQLAVAVLADDEGVDAAVVHAQVLAQQILQAGGVQNGAGTDDPVLGIARQLDGGGGQNINRVGHDQQDALKAGSGDLRNDAAHDAHVLVDQVQAGLAGLLGGAGGDNDDGRIGDRLIAGGVNLHGAGIGQAVADVHCLALGTVLVRVDEHHFREQSALHQGKGRGGADEAAAHNSHFSHVDHCNSSLLN